MITVYHGSIAEVQNPLVSLGRANLDFGKGFYVTDLRSQAESWARRMATRRFLSPILNVYELDIESIKANCLYLYFDAYDKAWLDFIIASRNGGEQWQVYDVIEGGVANDRVINPVEDYMRGRMSAEAALAELSKHQPNNQVCILNQRVIDRYLHFVQSIVI